MSNGPKGNRRSESGREGSYSTTDEQTGRIIYPTNSVALSGKTFTMRFMVHQRTSGSESFLFWAVAASFLGLQLYLPFLVFGEWMANDQVLHNLILLLAISAFFFYRFHPGGRLVPSPDLPVWLYLTGSVLLFGLSLWQGWLWLQLISLGVFLWSVALAFPGYRETRLTVVILPPFIVAALLLVALPWLDWPLRVFAGRGAVWIFDFLGKDPDLGLLRGAGEVMLILVVKEHPFHVAAECNGFGLLGSSLLLSLSLFFYRRVGVLDAFLITISAIFVAYLGNLARIAVIVLLAPPLMDHYDLMHEIVGTIAFYGVLLLIAWLVVGFGKSPEGQMRIDSNR